MHAVIIIPTYNEAESIATTVELIQKEMATIKDFQLSILIFDSHSQDTTVDIVKQLQLKYSNLFLTGEPQKTGLGSAYAQAMQFAMNELQADIVFEFDADGSHQPKHIPAMLKLIKQGHDVVIGSRYVKGGVITIDWPWYRHLLSKAGNWVAQLFLTRKYHDFTSGFRATRTSYLRKINLNNLLSKQYAYKIHLLWALHKAQAKIVETPIEFIDRTQGKSKFPRNNITDSLKVVLKLRLLEMKRYLKVCLCGFIGAGIQFIAFNILFKYFHPATANAVAIEITIIANFFMNNLFSFRDLRLSIATPKRKWLSKLIQFNVCSLGSMAIQVLIMLFGTHFLGKQTLTVNLLVAIGIGVGSIINYYLYKKIVWKPH